MKNLLVATLLSLSIVSVPLCAQDSASPDLTGVWKLNLEKGKLPKEYKTQSKTITISSSGLNVRFAYNIDGMESTETYVADGKEHLILRTQPAGGLLFAKAHWKKDVFITESISRISVPDSPAFDGSEVMHSTDRWQMSSDGLTLTEKPEGDPGQYVYDKQAAAPIGP
jgi:hypothetical protein